MKLVTLAASFSLATALLTTVCLAQPTMTPTAMPRPVKMPTPRATVAPSPVTPATVVPAAAPASPVPAVAPSVLTLTDAEKIALASSPSLVAARAAVDSAQAGVDIARSGELPNLSASGSYDRSKANLRTGTSAGSGAFLFTSNQAGASLRQLILDGGHVAATVASARFTTDSAKLTLVRDVQTVLLTVAQQYYTALQSRHQLSAAQDSLKVARVQERLVEAQYRAGVAARADVLTAQLPVAQAELAVAQAENGEASNVAALLDTMGLPATTPVTLQDDTSVSQSSFPLAQSLQVALASRGDLLAAKASVNAAQESVRAAKLQRFPLIQATASDGTSSTSPSGSNFVNTYSFGAGISFPIFDGGLIRGQVNAANAVAQTAQATLQSTELGVYLSVQQAYLGLQTAASGLASANVELSQSQTVLSVTNAQYKQGVTTLPLLLNAQAQLTKARSDQITALYNYKIAQQQMLYAEGAIGPSGQ